MGKVSKLHFLEIPEKSLKTRQLQNNGPLKNGKICDFWRPCFRNKNCWHPEFLMNQIFGQRFTTFETMRYSCSVMLILRAAQVATSFHWLSSRSFEKQAHKNSSKLDNTIFWKLLSKEMSGKSLKFFSPTTTKWQPFKFFAKSEPKQSFYD